MIVAKFGGSSMADTNTWSQVRAIIQRDRARRYIVVSAPGKRTPDDLKVTDLLLSCWQLVQDDQPIDATFEKIAQRFKGIRDGLSLQCDMDQWLEDVRLHISQGAGRDYAASRGEALCAMLFACYMDMPYVDAASCMRFDAEGRTDYKATYRATRRALEGSPVAVIPGFYGIDPMGAIRTFSRGGSDVTGALVACALDADLYENWTDVTGFLSADPRVVKDAQVIPHMTYRELRELSYMGATVLHEDAVFPVRSQGIPTALRNTFDPMHPGTMIHYRASRLSSQPLVTGIAGQKGYTMISLEKDQMNAEVGFARKVLQVFEEHGIAFEHLPTGIDALSVVVTTPQFEPHRQAVLDALEERVHPDVITVQDQLAMLATVGTGMRHRFGIAARLFTTLAEQGISISTMTQIPSELSIIIGIEEKDLQTAIRVLYDAFMRT